MNELPTTIKHKQFDTHSQRQGNVVAWLDETLMTLREDLIQAIQTKNPEDKQWLIMNIESYVSGLIDGNRFGKSYPYGENNPPINQPSHN